MATALAVTEMTTDDLAAARGINRDMREALADFDPMRFSRLTASSTR